MRQNVVALPERILTDNLGYIASREKKLAVVVQERGGNPVRVVIQRVSHARVQVAQNVVGAIDQGLLVLVCSQPGDHRALIERMLGKLLRLRIFSDEAGKMNRSVQDVQGGLLLVSQFTLAADVSRGNRPSFTGASTPLKARADYELLVNLAKAAHPVVQCGIFGADMQVSLTNDGPVTIPIEMTDEN